MPGRAHIEDALDIHGVVARHAHERRHITQADQQILQGLQIQRGVLGINPDPIQIEIARDFGHGDIAQRNPDPGADFPAPPFGL